MVNIRSKQSLIRSVYLISISLIFCAFTVIFYFNREIQHNFQRMQNDHIEVIIEGSRLKTLFSMQQIQIARFIEERKRSEVFIIQTIQQQIATALEQMEIVTFTQNERIEYQRLMRVNDKINEQVDILVKSIDATDQVKKNAFISANSSINLAIIFTDRILDSKYEQYNHLREENELKSRISSLINLLGGFIALFSSIFFYRFLSSNVAVLEEEGAKDALTGFYNKRSLQKYLDSSAIKNISEQDICISIMDIDDFKSINDRYGHVFGDEVIRNVANIISASIRPEDVAYRFGGEEFLIIFKKANLEESYKICERIRKCIAASHYEIQGDNVSLTITVGLALVNSQRNFSLAINLADKNLYLGKNSGKNKTVF